MALVADVFRTCVSCVLVSHRQSGTHVSKCNNRWFLHLRTVAIIHYRLSTKRLPFMLGLFYLRRIR